MPPSGIFMAKWQSGKVAKWQSGFYLEQTPSVLDAAASWSLYQSSKTHTGFQNLQRLLAVCKSLLFLVLLSEVCNYFTHTTFIKMIN
jgi:hypothetical protein